MARMGIGFFDGRGQFFKTPEDATVSDLSSMLGQIGDGESLAPGIAYMMLEKRSEIERIFAEHDAMAESRDAAHEAYFDEADNISVLPKRASGEREHAN